MVSVLGMSVAVSSPGGASVYSSPESLYGWDVVVWFTEWLCAWVMVAPEEMVYKVRALGRGRQLWRIRKGDSPADALYCDQLLLYSCSCER